MTCIVGFVFDGKCYLGGDAAGSETNGGNITARANPKVFFKNDYLFGYTTSFRFGDILEFICPPPKEKSKATSLRQHLVVHWIPILREKLKSEEYLEIEKSRAKGGTFIVGYKGELCTIHDDLQVASTKANYCSVGTGAPYALGALYALRTSKMKPREIISTALHAAACHNAYVREPFTIIESI